MRQMTNQEIASFCEQMAWLVHSGIDVGEALHLMAEDEQESFRKQMYMGLAEAVAEGTSFAEAVKAVKCFPVYVYGSLAAGEETGRQEEALKALQLYYEERERMNRRVRSALLQPAFLLCLLLLVLGVLLTQVVPAFQSVYASLGGTMTGVAGALLQAGVWLKDKLWVVCVVLGVCVVLVLLFAVCGPFRAWTTGLWKRYAGDKGVMRKVNDASIAQVMAMGLGSGLYPEDTLELAAGIMEDVPEAKKRCLACKDALVSGIPMLEALRQSKVLPLSACRLLSVGTQAGNQDVVMRELALKLSEEAEVALTGKVEKIEPAMVLTVSILVGAILLMVMLPLINIMETIG